jgi:hypothetical protein
MKRKVFFHLAIIALVAMACPSIARGDPPAGNELYLEVTIVTGEHSKRFELGDLNLDCLVRDPRV